MAYVDMFLAKIFLKSRFVFHQKLLGSHDGVKVKKTGGAAPCSLFVPREREEGAGESPQVSESSDSIAGS